jgi:hypothetical protein
MEFSTSRLNGNPSPGIYRNLTQADTTIHFISDHPMEYKLATYLLHINTMITLQCKQQEWRTIVFTSKNKCFPLKMIHNLKDKIR